MQQGAAGDRKFKAEGRCRGWLPVRLGAALATAACLAGSLGGCATAPDLTGAIASPDARTATEDDLRRSSQAAGEKYRANPKDANTAMAYAHSLRALGQRAQAVAVLEQASLANPGNKTLVGAYGRALADVGQNKQALEVLEKAHTPDNPDWRILSAQGAVLDQLGRHQEAQRYYASALKIAPGEPSVLSNLGLSYALSKDLRKAETTLRRAMAGTNPDARVRQNLALVVGLQGRFGEAEEIAKTDLSAEEAATNVAVLKRMLTNASDPKTAEKSGKKLRNVASATGT